MRLFMDAVIALLLAGLLAGFVWYKREDNASQAQKDFARAEVRRFQQQIALQSALAKVIRNERGYPETVDPDWFTGNLPVNPLLQVTHPWLEVAGPEQHNLLHPAQRVAGEKSLARFWYNPSTGVVRARVPAAVSDKASLDLYNYINECDLNDLFIEGR